MPRICNFLVNLVIGSTIIALSDVATGNADTILRLDTPANSRPITKLSEVDSTGFAKFVQSVDAGLKRGFCCDAVDITLSYIPLLSESTEIVAALPKAKGVPSCRLRSPWADIDVFREASGRVELRAVFRFDMPRMVADQATLSGLGTGAPPRPLSDQEFMKAAQYYAKALVTEGPGGPDMGALADALPPGLVWIFATAPQSTRGPFFSAARSAAARAEERLAPPHSQLVLALLATCLEPESPTTIDVAGIGDPRLADVIVNGKPFNTFLKDYTLPLNR